MSLDVYLSWPGNIIDKCPACGHEMPRQGPPFSYAANITHNLSAMADAAGLYTALWLPEDIGIAKATQLIPLLEAGLAELKARPSTFRTYNPKNGWGDYEGLVGFVERYLEACRECPDADVRVSR